MVIRRYRWRNKPEAWAAFTGAMTTLDTSRPSPETAAPEPATSGPTPRHGRWIDHWDAEDPGFWETSGARIARKNLALSMFAEHLGFGVWVVWTIVVLNLANAGIRLSISELFLLTLLPNLIGSCLRIPYTFAVPKFGGRAWTTVSAALLLIPTVLLAVLVPSHWLASQPHHTQMLLLALCAASSGVGGGNFASSMANISFFYPERRKGLALGLNAAGGNLGVAVTQLVIPLIVIIGVPATTVRLARHQVHLAYAGLVWLPFVAAAAILAWTRMDSLSQARSDRSAYVSALTNRHTWLLSFLYIGTFGSFIGYSFALPLVIKTSFPAFLAHHTFVATYMAGLGFLGALLGSLSRPLGGWLADRVSASKVTLAVFAGMAAFTGLAIAGVDEHSFVLFMSSFMVIFILSGIGNGSTYKMIPSVIAGTGLGTSGTVAVTAPTRRVVAAVIGIAGAVGALGGVLVQVVIRNASLHVSELETAAHTPAKKAAIAVAHSAWVAPALWAFLASYAVFGAVTYVVYVRARARRGTAVPALLPA
jgi:MFS transporter, NNP family, nitrate/nitrite transporter